MCQKFYQKFCVELQCSWPSFVRAKKAKKQGVKFGGLSLIDEDVSLTQYVVQYFRAAVPHSLRSRLRRRRQRDSQRLLRH